MLTMHAKPTSTELRTCEPVLGSLLRVWAPTRYTIKVARTCVIPMRRALCSTLQHSYFLKVRCSTRELKKGDKISVDTAVADRASC